MVWDGLRWFVVVCCTYSTVPLKYGHQTKHPYVRTCTLLVCKDIHRNDARLKRLIPKIGNNPPIKAETTQPPKFTERSRPKQPMPKRPGFIPNCSCSYINSIFGCSFCYNQKKYELFNYSHPDFHLDAQYLKVLYFP